jgi:N6-L-threonylcarbamoyladenine synthase
MRILSIDTSCDETSVSVTNGMTILSNVIWSQASLHAKFGGVFPSLAKRMHEERIDWVIEKSLKTAFPKPLSINHQSLIIENIDAVAVTAGPGLAIALEVGIKKAKEISEKYHIPLISVNHIEGHVLSCLAQPRNSKMQIPNLKQGSKFQIPNYPLSTIHFPPPTVPALGIVTSGGHTQVILMEGIGIYNILASTVDDALGEALDKAARMLGLGYPGGPILEKLAILGNPDKYELPTPLAGQEKRMVFSYSGLKTALYRKIEEIKLNNKELGKKDIEDLAAVFQKTAFNHFIRVLDWMIVNNKVGKAKDMFAGGGVMANLELRKRLRKLAIKHSLKIHFPYTKKLYGDNAGMIGVAAYFKANAGKFEKDLEKVDRSPNAKIDQPFSWQYNLSEAL